MKRTISIRLDTTSEQAQKLLELQEAYMAVCNHIVPSVQKNRCWNRVALHKLVYSDARKTAPLGSQMVCNAIFSVCKAYKAKGILPIEDVPLICFRKNRSVHFDHRTYTIREESISLYTLGKRIQVKMHLGPFQREYFTKGISKEGELICKKGKWYFIATTLGNGTLKIYVNGVLNGTNTNIGNYTPYNNNNPIFIGAAPSTSGTTSNHFIGALSDIRIHNRMLNSTEIKDIYE